MPVEMECFDGPRIAQRRGDLRSLGHEICSQALLQPHDLQEISAIVRPEIIWANPHPVDQVRRIRRANNLADARFTLRCVDGNALPSGGIHWKLD